ncbi:MAG TPA: DUF3299 domain-containing protein [Dokdonella sp.]
MSLRPFRVLALALLVAACSRAPAPPEQGAAPADSSAAADAAARAKAAADGAEAARAYARSRGLAPPPSAAQEAEPAPAPSTDGYAELDWLKMMPPEDLEALKNPAPVQHVGNMRMKQIGTYHTVPEVTGKKIKLPGYVVPIESDDQGRMTEFFFVPFFGACIHVPPPPPNQLVHAMLKTPIKTPQIWDPYWLRGELRIETTKNQIAGSAYTMDDAELVPYDG